VLTTLACFRVHSVRCKVMVLLWCEKFEILPMVFRILREVLFTGGNVALDWAELGTLLET